MSTQRIVFGGFTFSDSTIESVITENSISLVGEEFQSDVFEASVFVDGDPTALLGLNYATPIYYYIDEQLVGKYYKVSTERTATKKYTIHGTSMIGILGRESFYGGYYDGTETLPTILGYIVGGDGMTKRVVTSDNPPYEICKSYAPYGAYRYTTSAIGTTDARGYFTGESVSGWDKTMYVEFSINSARGASTGSLSFIAGSKYVGPNNDYGVFAPDYCVGIKYGQTAAGSSAKYITLFVSYGGVRYDFFDEDNLLETSLPSFTVKVAPTEGVIDVSYKYTIGGVVYGKRETQSISVSVVSAQPELGVVGGCALYRAYPIALDLAASVSDVLFEKYVVYSPSGETLVDVVPVVYTRFLSHGGTSSGARLINLVEYNEDYEPPAFSWADSFVGEYCGWYSFQIIDPAYIRRYMEFFDNLEFGRGSDSVYVSGWLPPCTKREAIYQLLFSLNLSLLKKSDGGMLISGISTSSAGEIPDSEMFDKGTEEYLEKARTISLTEHTYESGSEKKVVFDNTSSPLAEGKYIAMFDNSPVEVNGFDPQDPPASGLTIYRYNCNCALVSGRGTISGYPMFHMQNVLQRSSGSAYGSDVSVTNATLVTGLNSDNVMNKLATYYGENIHKVVASIIYSGQKCGLSYTITTPFEEVETAVITKMSSRASSFVKTECEFISGYAPVDIGGYNNYVILEKGSTWTVPQEVLGEQNPTIRATIIGKGYSGEAGQNGEDGAQPERPTNNAKGGKGGAGGDGGVGGKIYTVTIDVTNVRSLTTSQASGGDFTVTTYGANSSQIAVYSSASGVSAPKGFTNQFTGITYALPGNPGVNGAAGGAAGAYEESLGENGESMFEYNHVGGWSIYRDVIGNMDYGSGAGGGASAGNDGGNGQLYGVGGRGADGGIAIPNPVGRYGCGGNGGNGGGGGGGAAMCVQFYEDPETGRIQITNYWPASAGVGGIGGVGEIGKDGCVIIYY